MSRTYKDRQKRWDNWFHSFKAGTKKWWKKQHHKKMRKTPITSFQLDMQETEKTVTLKLPKNLVKGSELTTREIEITVSVKTPTWTEVENHPIGLDIWTLD